MRHSFDCSAVNEPKTIAGIEWRLVVGVFVFFGMTALTQHVWGVLAAPFLIVILLHGPAKKDPAFLQIYRRHHWQRERYSPAYITKKNLIYPRPQGFNRSQMV